MREETVIYEICEEGELSEEWTDWFDGLSIRHETGISILTGMFADQAALVGALSKVQALNLELVSVRLLAHQSIGECGLPPRRDC